MIATSVWSIRVYVEPEITDEQADALVDSLSAFSAAIGPDSAQLAVDATTAETAMRVATKATTAALRAEGVPHPRVVGLELKTWERFEYELEQPDLPRLVGLAEIGKLLGVSRQRVGQLAQGPAFPEPAARLATGPVWTLPAIDRWSAGWARKSGRPARAG